jgi:two-component system response regulator HydG
MSDYNSPILPASQTVPTTSGKKHNADTTRIIYRSEIMSKLIKMVERVAPSQASVLVLGESGTGKELIAKAIHERSPRRNKPIVSINCGALRETLLESELFGHEKGSFTGAYNRKIGLAEVANGGTLFLDEIGELSQGIQAKLLRFLQEGEIFRVGGKEPIRVDVRIVSATNKDLEQDSEPFSIKGLKDVAKSRFGFSKES